MSDPVYCYPPDHTVLRNKLGIRDASQLKSAEVELVQNRIAEGCPKGDFGLGHLKAIHHHLFQDVYDWAGKTRTVEISKGSSQFMPRQFIETGMADVHRRITKAGYFEGSSPERFAGQAAEIIGDVNHVHPFREGNGRTQLIYLKQLGERAGHRIDLTRLERDRWIEASKAANRGDYGPMRDSIASTLIGTRDRIGQQMEKPHNKGRDR